jgi:hypothetical protein
MKKNTRFFKRKEEAKERSRKIDNSPSFQEKLNKKIDQWRKIEKKKIKHQEKMKVLSEQGKLPVKKHKVSLAEIRQLKRREKRLKFEAKK